MDEPRRLVADEPHAMGEKLHVFVMGRCFHHLLGPADDLTAERARLDRLARALLDRIDQAQKVDQLGVGVGLEDGHAAQVADVAMIVAAGIE